MARNVNGPLYYERLGRSGPIIAFVHPNPMDQSCWIFQNGPTSTLFNRSIRDRIPGYGCHSLRERGLTWTTWRRRAGRRSSAARSGEEDAILVRAARRLPDRARTCTTRRPERDEGRFVCVGHPCYNPAKR